MQIPLINVSKQNQALRAEIDRAIAGVIDTSAFIMGKEVSAFEQEFAAYTKVNYAISCASGTDALLLPLMAMDIKPGDEVLVPSFTFYATAASVARLGAKPVFIDSDDSYNLSFDDLKRKMNRKVKAIIPVHLFGLPVDMPTLMQIAKDAGVFVLEDVAQSMGAAINEKQAGTYGDFGAFSFYPTKNLGAMGDAGMMCARDEAGAEKLRMLRVHGSKVRYYHDLVGTNSRLDSIQAAILRIKLKHLSEYEANRKKIATHYIRCLQEAGLGEAVRLPIFDPKRKHVWNQFTVRVQRRDSLRSYLADKGIGSEIYYPLPMHLQKSFASSGFKSGDLPVCEKMAEEVLSLPMFPELSLQDVETVVANIKDFYKK